MNSIIEFSSFSLTVSKIPSKKLTIVHTSQPTGRLSQHKEILPLRATNRVTLRKRIYFQHNETIFRKTQVHTI